MKNVIKGFAVASMIICLGACNSDKPADNSASIGSAAATPPVETPTMSSPANPVTTTPIATPVSNATTTPSKAVAPTTMAAPNTPMPSVGEKVMPNQANVTPAPPVVAGGKTTTAKFEETSYDWGSLKEGEKMTHLFKFKNTGTNDMIISDAHGSCGCTVPEWPKEPIKPGKGSEIKVVFDSKGKTGDQAKTVTLTANTEPANMVLMIKGKVIGKEEMKN